MHQTDWLPGIIALVLGLIGGLLLWRMVGRRGAPPSQVHGHSARLEELRARQELELSRLRELRLELDGERDPAAIERLERERQRLELDAARTLRALEEAERSGGAASPAPAAAPPPGQGFLAARPVLRGFLWGAGSTSFLFLLAFLLLDFLPGGSAFMARPEGGPMTGGDAVMSDRARGQADPELQALQQRILADPQDLEAKLDLAQALIFRDLLVDAFGVVQEVARVKPDHPRALAYEGVVRLAMGQGERSLELLDQAVALDPQFTEAWVRRGLTAFELGRFQLAIDSWEKALEQRPDGAPALQPVIEEARRRLEGGPPAGGDGEAAAAAHPPTAAPSAGAAAAEGPGVRLSLELGAEAAAKVQPGSTLFVYARPAGVLSGPPIAAKRLRADSLPLEVELTQDDSMLGQPLPERLSIEARIDRDGDPMTRDPDDPIATQDGLELGKPPTRLVLQ